MSTQTLKEPTVAQLTASKQERKEAIAWFVNSKLDTASLNTILALAPLSKD